MTLPELTADTRKVIEQYRDEFDVELNADWFAFKLQEEFGEMIHDYLVLTGRNRRKATSQVEATQKMGEEVADVFCFLLLLAQEMNIDIEQAVRDKWFSYLKK